MFYKFIKNTYKNLELSIWFEKNLKFSAVI